MGGMPDLIVKAPVFARLEAWTRAPGNWQSSVLDSIINRLTGPVNDPANGLVQIGIDFGFYADLAKTEHLRNDWFNEGGNGFWQNVADVEGIMRKGLAKTCELFKQTGKPVELFWVISSSDQNDSRWEMSTSICNEILLVIFHTPQAPCDTPTKDNDWTWISKLNKQGKPVTHKAKLPDPEGTASASKSTKKKSGGSKTKAKAPGAKTGAKRKPR
jgi:hypothetical protein